MGRVSCLFATLFVAQLALGCRTSGHAYRPDPKSPGTVNASHAWDDRETPGFDAHSVFLRTLRSWTRSAKIYQGLDNKMFVSATYHAPGFRRAFAVAFPDIYGHGGKITRRELVDMTGGVEQHHNFFISVYTPDVRWNDLARDDSIWRMSLYSRATEEDTLGEAEVAPDDIIPIKMDENLRAVYPYISRFDRTYLVRFPLADRLHRPLVVPETDEVVLRIASALGSASMRWPTHGLIEGPSSSH